MATLLFFSACCCFTCAAIDKASGECGSIAVFSGLLGLYFLKYAVAREQADYIVKKQNLL